MKLPTSNASTMLLVLLAAASSVSAYQPGSPQTNSVPSSSSVSDRTRRFAFLAVPAAVALTSTSAQALDMDSFIARELDNKKSTEPAKMNDDVALCKFGAPSQKTGEACLRAGLSTKRPTGVDAFGSVDRGDFVRCKLKYIDDPDNKGMLKKTYVCN